MVVVETHETSFEFWLSQERQVAIGAAPPVFIGFFRKKQFPPLGLARWQVGGDGGLGEVWPGVTVGRCGRV